MPPDYVGIVSYAGLTNLEREDVSTFAGIATTEKEAQQTFAGTAYLRYEVVSALAGIAGLEREAISTLAGDSALERESFSTYGMLSTLEGVPLATLACLADLVYFIAPSVKLEPQIIDRRSMGPRSPVYRAKYPLTLIVGETEISTRLEVNVEIKQITIETPGLDGGTAKVQLFDEIGARIYESGDAAESSLTALITTAGQSIPLAGISTLKVVASKAQEANVVFIVVLYGT